MRAVVLALALALVAGTCHSLVPDFLTKKTYVYMYETQLFSGLPENGLARAGLKLRSKVYISAIAGSNYMAKLVEPELHELLGVWPRDNFSKAPSLTAALKPQLTIPITFEYTNGTVGKIFARDDMSTMTLNIYRGILNVLQLSVRDESVYELQEEGVQGVCKTFYAINEDVKADRILLTKTRNLNQCQEWAMKDVGLAFTEKCVRCRQDSENLRGNTVSNYVLKRVANGCLILEASVEDLIQFSPFTHENGVTEMKTKQSLVFLETLTVPVVRATPHRHRGSLKYEFSTELLQTPIQLVNITEVETQIREILDYMIKNNRERVHEDAPRKFLELIQLLRAAQLENIWKRNKRSPAYRQWLLDAIPAIGTPAALRFIKEKYLSDELSDAEAAQALIASAHMVTADEEVIRQFQGLTIENKTMQNPVLHGNVLLGYGTMVSKYCTANKDCPPDIVMPIHLCLKEALHDGKIQDISLYLKVLGNAGHPASIKSITKALPIHGTRATSLPMRIHADAILALRNIAKREPRKIQEMALQLYMNKALHPELRMLACIVLFETKPPVGLVTALASLVNKEENLQVASFTYSHMKSMTRCTAAYHASVAAACNVAIRFLSPKVNRLSFRLSKAIHMDIYNRPLMLGAAASAFYMNDVGSIMPRSIMAKTSAYVAGAAADVLEVGVRTEGLQEAFLKNLHITDNVDRITKMKRVIDAVSHLKTLPISTPLASIYVKIFGQEVAFANINAAFVNQLIATDPAVPTTDYYVRKMLSGVDFHTSKPLLAAEMRRILPTAAGLPMEINLYTSAVAAGTVQVKVGTSPVLQQEFRFAHLLRQEIHIETEIRPSVAVNTFAVMGINTAMFQAAVVSRGKFSSIMPVKIAARFNLANGNIKIEALPVSVPDVVALQVDSFVLARAVTTTKTTPIIPAKLLSPTSAETGTSQSSEINMPDPEPIKAAEVAKKYCTKFPQLGLQSCLRVRSASISDIALYKLAGKLSMALSFKPIKQAAIERLELEFQLGPRAATKIIKETNLSEDEIAETQPVLKKLRKILTPGLKNSTAPSFSSSSRSSKTKMSSSHPSSHSSGSSSGSSSSSSSNSSSSSSSSNSSSSGSSSGGSSGGSSGSSSLRSQMSSRFSSASSLASLFSASSRSSSHHTSPRHLLKNKKKHKKTTSTSEALSTSKSSFEAINSENKFLGKDEAPYLVILARAVRIDRKAAGYQLAVYMDKPKTRIQIILANLAADSNWMMCADGVVLNQRKVAAKIGVGARCKDVETTITAAVDDKRSAVEFRMTWRNVPSAIKGMAKRALNYIPASMALDLVERKKLDSIKKLSLAVVATSNTLNFIFETSTRIAYQLAVPLPDALSLQEIRSLPPFSGLLDAIHHLFAKATAAECSFSRGTLTTFNKRRHNIPTFPSCPQILAQDCTDELKFIVLLKKDEGEQYSLNVKIARDDIDLYQKNHKVFVKVNEMDIPITSLPYKKSTGSFQIRQKNEGVSIYAPSYGLHEVYFDTKLEQVKLMDWMRGQSCGLCGHADGETRQEFRTPSRRLTQNAVSHAFSWVLPARSCRENTECRLRLESVRMEREMIVHGHQSRCYSVEPVLRCLPGCFAVKTATVDVGFHCVPTASNVNDFEVQRHIHEKSTDLTETTEAHLACSCTAKCA